MLDVDTVFVFVVVAFKLTLLQTSFFLINQDSLQSKFSKSR